MANEPQPLKRLATTAIVIFIIFMGLGVIDLLTFPSWMTIISSGYPEEVYDATFYTFFQFAVYVAGYHPYAMLNFISICFQGMLRYAGIPFAAIGASYLLVRWRDPVHLLDKDHARPLLLLGYLILIISLTPFINLNSLFQASRVLNLELGDALTFVFFSFMPQMVYIAFSLVLVVIFHVAIARINRGAI